jgi:hypothetical protein
MNDTRRSRRESRDAMPEPLWEADVRQPPTRRALAISCTDVRDGPSRGLSTSARHPSSDSEPISTVFQCRR